MKKNIQVCVLVGLVALLFIPEASQAQIFRRWRGNYNYNYNYNGGGNFFSAPLATVAKPFVGMIRRRSNRNRSEYDYNWAARRVWHNDDAGPMLFADKVRVKVLLKDETAKAHEDLRIHVSYVYLHKSKTWHKQWVDLVRDGDEVYFDVTGLEEGRVVKIVPDLYRKTAKDEPEVKTASFVQGKEDKLKYLGRMHAPYYGVTSSEDNEELQRRAQIVSFGLSQWYADEAYGGRYCNYDCHSFFTSSTSGELKGFKLQPVSRANVPKLAKQGKRFHGDYLIMPGHYGMALCYDEDTGNFCTLEGNYALNGPYRINIDPYRHGLNTWSSIMTISQVKEAPAKDKETAAKEVSEKK